MDTKGSQNLSPINLASIPLVEEDGVVYIAIKGSLHASDCSVFGLGEEEVKALAKKFPGSGVVVNGVGIKANVLAAINSLGQLGYKIISSTAFNGDKDRVRMLIEKARNAREAVNAPDNSGYTPLHYSARKGYTDICNIFIQNRAQVNATTKSGKATPLHKATAAGHVEAVKLLIKSGATVDFQDVDGQTALHKAVQYKHFDLINILVEASPGLDCIKDIKGHIAADYMPSPND